ncbi:ubiquitin thioesterase OTU1 [Nematocida ausubeli]|nr:ubiquitin thioesterase OTU1 [Nematocida ausubeli]
MRFKIIDDTKSFIYEIEGTKTISDLYEGIENKVGSKRFLFKGVPKCLVERADCPIMETFTDLECIYAEASKEVKGPVETTVNTLTDENLVFSIFEVPSDNSCLFHSLSELLNAKSSSELRKMVANEILQHPKKFMSYIEKTPFEYSTWIVQPDIWGGATEITIISKIYSTKVAVIDNAQRVYEFGDEFRSVVYLSYSGSHYNAVVAKDRNGNVVRKFPCGDKSAEEKAKKAVQEFFRV